MVTTDISMPSGKTRKDDLDETVLARIDQYELVSELGGGGFGTVYLAKDTTSGVHVAVKGLPPFVKNNREELENIRENFALVSRLTHTNIAKALVLHPAKDVSYASEDTQQKLRVFADDFLMVMEYAPGVTLSKWRKQFPERRAPVPNAIAIVRQIASALDYAHGQHIIHRDIKPANVMIETQADGKLIARVLDFGLAAEIRSSMGHVSREIHDTSGTRPYMAPEQWLGGRQGAATDQYSLAVLFHELVTGDVPFASVFDTGDPMVMLNAIGHNPVELPDDLPACVRAALEKALSKKPSDRFESCTDFVDALDGKKMVEPLTSPDHVTKPDNDPPHLFPVGKIAIALFVMAAIGVCSWFAMSQIAHQDKSMPLPEPTLQPATHLQPIPSPQPAPPQPAPAPVPKVDEAMKSEALIMKGKAGQARDRNAKEEWHSWPLFDTRARDVESLYRAGVEAFDKADYKLAKEMFAKIRENMRWLDSNKILRINASTIRQKALSSKSNAEGLEASRFASSEWELASSHLSAAERLFDDGQFKQAESDYTSAEEAFRRSEKIAKAAKKSADRANATSKFIAAYNEKRYDDAAQLRHDIDLNNVTVQFDLGWMYANGSGLSKDDKEAVRWYRKAAENGSLMAQFNLGVMYSKGEGVDKDERESEKWYRKAAEGGYEKAKEALQRIAKVRAAEREANWHVGSQHPHNPNLVADVRLDTWRSTRPGYVWVEGTDRDEWKAGIRHPENSKLKSDWQEGKWTPTEEGYVWTGGSRTEWRAGIESTKHPHWVSIVTDEHPTGYWRPMPGYSEKNKDAEGLSELVWTPGVIIKGRKTGNREGEWLKKCIRCKGTGRVTQRTKCSSCDGSGKIKTKKDCLKCDGSGKVRTTSSVKCPNCGRDEAKNLLGSLLLSKSVVGKVACPKMGESNFAMNNLGTFNGQFLGMKHVFLKGSCLTCGGQGRFISPMGLPNCISCGGYGYIWEFCNTCKGEGFIPCGTCGGSGEVRRTEESMCNNCDGDGWVYKSSQCSYCKGEGESSSTSSCNTCSGDGWVVE